MLPFGGQVMILGAFILGPLSAYLLKLFDNLVAGKVKAGFEMLIDNFSIGILGGALAIFGYKVIEPVVGWITDRLGDGVESLVNHSLLPLASVIIEPAKVLFLNNAINHGVLTPLGAAEVQEQGKSILFMLEANPGPGAGLLLAYLFFGPRSLRPTVPAAMIIQFFGGIHEIYFPYVLMKPKTDPRHHRRRRVRDRDLPGVRRRPHRPGGTRQLHRVHGRDGEGRLPRRDPGHRGLRGGRVLRRAAPCSASAATATTRPV